MRVYVNGRQVLEREREFKKREGGIPVCYPQDHRRHRLPLHRSGRIQPEEPGRMEAAAVRDEKEMSRQRGRHRLRS